MTFQYKTIQHKTLADLHTPVSVYLRLRDKFPQSILLESSDYHSKEESFSYICCEPISQIIVNESTFTATFPDGQEQVEVLTEKTDFTRHLTAFQSRFSYEEKGLPFTTFGLFGFSSFSSVQYVEDITFTATPKKGTEIPDCFYSLFKYVIVLDHFKSEMYFFEHLREQEESELEHLKRLVNRNDQATFSFQLKGEESCNDTDDAFRESVRKGKAHCQAGDVFQLVLSRSFSQSFSGDEFNVYRALRSINPSPYLFFFDFGDFKLFGSSPEAQLTVNDGIAGIHPIAGTYKRTGDDEADQQLAMKLSQDIKEMSEHVMLVDLARNDLSRHGQKVHLEKYCEIQFFSHVIHMVSEVTASIGSTSALQIAADTFPAGTLSGAPKYRAMELIDALETHRRGFYGGAIGIIGFNNTYNHAILIRSFLSKHNELHFQAGAGIVSKSVEENELQEVNNKVAALRRALKKAEEL